MCNDGGNKKGGKINLIKNRTVFIINHIYYIIFFVLIADANIKVFSICPFFIPRDAAVLFRSYL